MMRSSLEGKSTTATAKANATVRKGKATQRKGKNNGDRSVPAHSVPVLLTIAKCAMDGAPGGSWFAGGKGRSNSRGNGENKSNDNG